MILFTLTFIPLLGINWNSIYYLIKKLSTPLDSKKKPFTPPWSLSTPLASKEESLEAVHSFCFMEESLEAVDAPCLWRSSNNTPWGLFTPFEVYWRPLASLKKLITPHYYLVQVVYSFWWKVLLYTNWNGWKGKRVADMFHWRCSLSPLVSI